jgi:hypothetical protein
LIHQLELRLSTTPAALVATVIEWPELPDCVEKLWGCRGIIASLSQVTAAWGAVDDGDRQVRQDALFYEFSLERHVPGTHLLRTIDRFVELDGVGKPASGPARTRYNSKHIDLIGDVAIAQSVGDRGVG